MNSIDMIFLFVLAAFIGYYMCKKDNHDSFEGFAAIDDARQAVKEVYNADVDAIRNLSAVATKLQAGGLTHPGRLTVNSGNDHIPIIAQSNTDSHILLKTKNDGNKDTYLINRDGTMKIWAGNDHLGVNRNGTVDIPGNLNTPQIRRVGGDWLRINNDGVGRTALYGNLAINDSIDGNGGLAVGSWNDKVGQGNIAATGSITANGNITANSNITANGKVSFGGGMSEGIVNIRNRDGRYTHFNWPDGQNYIRGNTIVDGNMSVNGPATVTGARGKGGCGRFEENSLTCPDGKVMVGLEFWHPCGQDWTYQEQFRLICK
jgi:hypothetical protein